MRDSSLTETHKIRSFGILYTNGRKLKLIYTRHYIVDVYLYVCVCITS